ncbi:MAG: radical SAM protein [bacterium]
MSMDSVKAVIGEAVLKQGLRYIERDPEKNLLKLANWASAIATDPEHKQYLVGLKECFSDPQNAFRGVFSRVFKQASHNVREKLLVNFFLNSILLGIPKSKALGKKFDINIPWALLMDPTGRCNLTCTGCWAKEYDRSQDMDYDTLDRVISEAESVGMHFILFSGGEPTVRMNDILSLAKKHGDSTFAIFTNGTLISKDVARTTEQIGNIFFAISVDGMETETNERRGKGVFGKVMAAMDNLREVGCLFGFSVTYHRYNVESIATDQFIDLLIEKGCVYGWFFTYVPVGGDINLEYMATPEQRALMYNTMQRWRATKPVAAVDFWNDGHLSGGCVAGGRGFLHINAAGDVEPCAFVHYANVNIKNVSLVEALGSPLFKLYQRNQPFNRNHLRPCPIIDNPQFLEQMVKESGAYPTQRNRLSASDLCSPLHPYAQSWGEMADRLLAEREADDRQRTSKTTPVVE